MTTMPVINLEKIKFKTEADRKLAAKIIGRGNRLRSQKPKGDGDASYLWRMVAFMVSPHRHHHCMPVTAEFDMDRDKYWGPSHRDASMLSEEDRSKLVSEAARRRQKRCAELHDMVDLITNSIQQSEHHGANAWINALYWK